MMSQCDGQQTTSDNRDEKVGRLSIPLVFAVCVDGELDPSVVVSAVEEMSRGRLPNPCCPAFGVWGGQEKRETAILPLLSFVCGQS